MQNLNWQRAIALAVLLVSFATLAVAQRINGEARSAIFATAPRMQTKVQGVTIIAGPPKGFNPLTATNAELLTYGLPQRPNKDTDAKNYSVWERAMLALKTHATNVEAKPYTSREMMGGKQVESAEVSGVTFYNSGNWSGIANTNHLKVWDSACGTPAKCSFDEIFSYWPVPVANHPFGNLPCSEGPWLEVTWNGIDGFNNGDVVQGGSFEEWDDGGCGGPVGYFGWVEWYPSYPILEIFCGSSACPVGPGDPFLVETFAASGTNEQFVFVEDIEQQWSGTFGLTYQSGPGVVGSSAEQIVERPCCNGNNLYPLANYIFEWFDDAVAFDVAGTAFYPGSAAASTAIITMLADDGSAISTPLFYGTAGNQGRYSIWMEDEGCAYSGGCTP
jgi:peptidase A4-like protein